MDSAFEHRRSEQSEQPEAMEFEEVDFEEQKLLGWDQQSVPWVSEDLQPHKPLLPELQELQELQQPMVPWVSNEEAAGDEFLQQEPQEDLGAPSLDGFDCLPELSASDVQKYFRLMARDPTPHNTMVIMVVESGCAGGSSGSSGLQQQQQQQQQAEQPPQSADDAESSCDSTEWIAEEESAMPSEPLLLYINECEQAAQWILGVHDAVGRDFSSEMPRFKKKPMVHEFFGYILFLGSSGRVPVLQGSAHFCHKTGERVAPTVAKSYFRVLNFPAVAQVWRRMKSNSSSDCIKNLKRAMRMSISNDRQYFVDLKQAYHRLHIYKFGIRSMEFFQRIFPDWFRTA